MSDPIVIIHKDSSLFLGRSLQMVFSFVILLNVKAVDHNCKIITHCSERILS